MSLILEFARPLGNFIARRILRMKVADEDSHLSDALGIFAVFSIAALCLSLLVIIGA